MDATNSLRNVTIGRASTVHTTTDNDGVHASCGASMRRNGHRGGSTPTSRPATCLACTKSANSPAAMDIDEQRRRVEWSSLAAVEGER